MLGFTLYNFDNKYPFIVIVIVIVSIAERPATDQAWECNAALGQVILKTRMIS